MAWTASPSTSRVRGGRAHFPAAPLQQPTGCMPTGVAWFGFDSDDEVLDGFWEVGPAPGSAQPARKAGGLTGAAWQPEELGIPYTGLSMEFQTVVQRLSLMGFNAVRLPISFAVLHAGRPHNNYTLPCRHPPLEYVRPSSSACSSVQRPWEWRRTAAAACSLQPAATWLQQHPRPVSCVRKQG